MTIIGARKIPYIVSGTLIILSLAAFFVWGLKLGIDFTGGSLLEIEFNSQRPSVESLQGKLRPLNLGNVVLQQTGEKDMLVRLRDLDEPTHQRVLAALGQSDPQTGFVEKRFDSIGPTIGRELKRRAIYALILVVVMIVMYVAWAFRKVSRPVQSWKYGVVAIIALMHDVFIPTGVFAYLGHFKGVEVDALFITALLTILGFSVHDTIVVFDRIRENLRRGRGKNFEDTVEISIRETMVRSINTSLTLFLVLLTLFFFGGESTKYFSLALIIGTIFGTYSSIFIASPLLVTWEHWRSR